MRRLDDDFIGAECMQLRESSRYIRTWMRNQPNVKEESLTDWLLYDISSRIPRISYHVFSRIEEARTTGADWEWWFLLPRFSVAMRILAKKINVSGSNYRSLAQANRYGRQIERLLEDAERGNFLPLYAFYSFSQEIVMCGRRIKDEGVFLAGARTLYADFVQVGRRPVNASDILERSTAISCLLCCHLLHGCPEPCDYILFLRERFPSELGDQERGIHPRIPQYVYSFVEYAPQGLPEWWENEYRSQLQNVNALLVYDGRDLARNRSSEWE